MGRKFLKLRSDYCCQISESVMLKLDFRRKICEVIDTSLQIRACSWYPFFGIGTRTHWWTNRHRCGRIWLVPGTNICLEKSLLEITYTRKFCSKNLRVSHVIFDRTSKWFVYSPSAGGVVRTFFLLFRIHRTWKTNRRLQRKQ